jgi:hypothetical protein
MASMMLLNTSLLRERFTITEKGSAHPPLLAFGNRILLPLTHVESGIQERFVVRAHTMHMALRMSAAISYEFYKSGPIITRPKPMAWKEKWFDISSDFERPHTPETWISVYHNGRVIYQDGYHHPFLDIIEKCDIKNRAEYDRAIIIAKDIFKEAGRDVNIDHDVNIACVIGAMNEKIRCGLILRAPSRTTTFNLSIEKHKNDSTNLYPHHGLNIAADYLEAIQLSVSCGYVEQQIANKKISETSNHAQKSRASYRRIGRLNQSILSFENSYQVKYRPEKPDFSELKDEAFDNNRLTGRVI